MEIKNLDFLELKEMEREGIVLLGCGGDPLEWINGVTQNLFESEIFPSNKPEDNFSDFVVMTTTGGRTDIAMIFKIEDTGISIGKMAMWRLRFGDCSWVSDYIVNYATQHGYYFETENNDSENE